MLSPPARPRCPAEPCPGATRSTASGWQLLAPAAELHSPRLGMKTRGLYLLDAGISRGWHPAVVICGAVKQHRDRNEPWEPRPDRARERAACPRCAGCWGQHGCSCCKRGGKKFSSQPGGCGGSPSFSTGWGQHHPRTRWLQPCCPWIAAASTENAPKVQPQLVANSPIQKINTSWRNPASSRAGEDQ